MSLLLLLVTILPQVEVELRTASTQPKFRVRDGETRLSPDSVFSRELDAESSVTNLQGALRTRWDEELFSFDFWTFEAEGSADLPEAKNIAGGTFPAGTPTDTDVLFRHLELGWRHPFSLGKDWTLDAGLDLEHLVVDADLGIARTRLDGLFPTVQLALHARPLSDLEAIVAIGGFFIPFVNGDTEINDPIQYVAQLKWKFGELTLGLGYDLYHVHLEENQGETEEDIVHLRLRSLQLILEYRF